MTKQRLFFHKMTFIALIILALGAFTSISLSALSHVAFAISGFYFLFAKRDFKIPLRVWGLVAVIVSCWLSVFFNWNTIEEPLSHLLKTKYFIVGIISFFSLKHGLKEGYLDAKKIRILLNILFITTAIATISGLIGLFTGFNPIKFKEACHPERACGLFGMWMTYAYGLGLFLILAIGLFLYRKDFQKYLNTKILVSSIIINSVGLFFSYTRGAWLGLLVGIPFFFWKESKKKFIIYLVLGVTLLGGMIITNDRVRDTFTNRSESNHGRIIFYKAAYYAFIERPVFGWGYKNFEPNSQALKDKYNLPGTSGHAHNNLMEHLASTGALGAIAFILFCILWIIDSHRRQDAIGRIMFPFVVSFIVSGMVQYTFGDGENLFLIMLALVI